MCVTVRLHSSCKARFDGSSILSHVMNVLILAFFGIISMFFIEYKGELFYKAFLKERGGVILCDILVRCLLRTVFFDQIDNINITRPTSCAGTCCT